MDITSTAALHPDWCGMLRPSVSGAVGVVFSPRTQPSRQIHVLTTKPKLLVQRVLDYIINDVIILLRVLVPRRCAAPGLTWSLVAIQLSNSCCRRSRWDMDELDR
jgi:hypothetical protein